MNLQRIRFYTSVAALNAATLLLLVNAFHPLQIANTRPVYNVQPAPALPALKGRKIISGKPVRIVVPRLSIDLSVIDGAYNSADGSWTLTKDKAQFALLTSPVNDYQGNTLIYGHNNKLVFSKLLEVTAGDQARVYTDNGHIFLYNFTEAEAVQPDDVRIFEYRGAPKLTLQTCSGDFYQFRKLFEFSFVKVEQ